jgi:hypothetical protein
LHDDAQPPITAGDAPGDLWSATRKVAFRFAFAYFVVYLLPFPLDALPSTSTESAGWTDAPWHVLVPWVGAHILHLATPITIFEAGSGDTTYNYVQLLCFVAISLITTVAWSLLDARRPNYAKLSKWLRVYVRFALATTMIAYGSMKVIKAQFPSPDLYTLAEQYGQSSPMGLLWNFMGFSLPYNIFTGCAEMGAGLLLAFRRTTTLGALLAVSVLANIVMLNFSYDVPVKLYSLHLLAMAIFILLPEARKLIDLFVFNRARSLNPEVPLFTRPRLDFAARMLGAVFVAASAVLWLSSSVEGRKTYGDTAPKPPLYGLYEVATFVRNGDTIPPLLTDTFRWRRVVVVYPGSLSIRSMSDSGRGFAAEVDTVKGVLTLTPRQDSTTHFVLSYVRPDSAHLTVHGTWAADTLHVEMVRRDEGDFLLMNRGFHWINETPYNR